MTDIYAFGSAVSGDFDEGSDTDILAIEQPDENRSYPSEWSVYSQRRLKELFQKGTLFAWHLYLEAVPIHTPNGKGYLHQLGAPSAYSSAKEEISMLKKMASRAIDELNTGTPSWIYELGLLGVAIRDVGMAASKDLTGSYNFSKNAPFQLKFSSPPVSLEDYLYLLHCRRATTRGIDITELKDFRFQIVESSSDIVSWFDEIINKVSEAGREKVFK